MTDLDRRAWLVTGAASALLGACGKHDTPPAAGSAADPCPKVPADAAVAPTTAAVATFAIPHDELVEQSIAQLADKLVAKTETSVSLVAKYKARIAATNERGPMLRAVLEVAKDVDAQAAQLDAERAAGRLRGPLHGIPILVKDNIDVAGTITSAGSLALADAPAARDATVIAKLRAAGAIVLGKTNLSEWANFRGLASSSGWSARGGQCRNPYALDRTPSGSSSGSGTAVAASLCAAALGSETDGSIVSPASVAGLVGVKPTIGLVSRTGVIPIALSQDTVGPMARTVRDAALLLAAIAGPDPDDAATAGAKVVDYAAALDPKALAGARLGVPRKGLWGVNRAIDQVMTAALARLKELGAVIVDPAELEAPPELGPAEIAVLVGEMAPAMATYLARRPEVAPKTLADVVAFNQAHAERELAYYGQEFFEQSIAAGGTSAKAYVDARALCLAIARDKLIDATMAKYHLDAFVAPTNAPAPPIDQVNGDGSMLSCSTLPAIAGYPHVTVWGGDRFGLPIGLSFFGKPFTEARLLAYAYAWEQATHLRQPPRYLERVQLG